MSITEMETGAATWAPLVRVDLTTASKDNFTDNICKLEEHAKAMREAGTLPEFPFDQDGWYDINPQMAEAALLNSDGNRETNFNTIKNYADDMVQNDWAATGESISASGGKLKNGHHRLIACYLSGVSFRCFVVTSIPTDVANIFAYYDSGRKRSAADALHIAGLNGSGKAVSAAVQHLSVRYDHDLLGHSKQPRMKPVNARQVLAYTQAHPDLQHAAHLMLGTYPAAVEVIRSKPAAIQFAWLVLKHFDAATLADFCDPLGSGALLPEDSPLLAARNKLMAPEPKGNKMQDRTRLAYVCKAFMMHVSGQKMPRSRGKVQPLGLDVDEAFPRIERPAANAAEAA